MGIVCKYLENHLLHSAECIWYCYTVTGFIWALDCETWIHVYSRLIPPLCVCACVLCGYADYGYWVFIFTDQLLCLPRWWCANVQRSIFYYLHEMRADVCVRCPQECRVIYINVIAHSTVQSALSLLHSTHRVVIWRNNLHEHINRSKILLSHVKHLHQHHFVLSFSLSLALDHFNLNCLLAGNSWHLLKVTHCFLFACPLCRVRSWFNTLVKPFLLSSIKYTNIHSHTQFFLSDVI